jgi:hypothetical protein
MKRYLPTLAAATTLILAACATPQQQLQNAVTAGRAEAAIHVAQKTPTLDGERTLDVALRDAARIGRPQVIVELIARGAAPNSGRNLSPLMYAAWRGHSTSVEALLAHGADPNRATPKFYRTALMYAARFGNEDTVRALLAGGADARSLDWRGRDAAGYARESSHYDLIPLLAGATATSAAPAAAPTPAPASAAPASPTPAPTPGDAEEELDP